MPDLPRRHAGIDVLVADDDAASRRFLADGLTGLGARVTLCDNGLAALDRARENTFALLLLDCRMPGAGAQQIISALRMDETAGSHHAIAVASSADMAADQHAALLAAGFSDILLKPCQIADLLRVLALLPDPRGLLLDDPAALAASGDMTTMRALRGLLREELESFRPTLDNIDADREAFAERLHRLRSSCGFCGAAALAAETVALQRQLASPPAARAPFVQRFGRVLASTLQALDD